MGIHSQQSFSLSFTTTTPPTYQSCLDEERAERDSERAARSVTARSCETTSRVSPSPPSAVSRAVVVSSVSLASSTRRPVVSSRSSSRTSSATLSPTPSTPSARLSPPSTSSTLSRDRAEPSTVSAHKRSLGLPHTHIHTFAFLLPSSALTSVLLCFLLFTQHLEAAPSHVCSVLSAPRVL